MDGSMRKVLGAGALLLWGMAALRAGEKPFWTEQSSYVQGPFFYAVGIASKAPSVEEGRRRAFENGIEEVRQFIQADLVDDLVFETQMTFEEAQPDGSVTVYRLLRCSADRLAKEKKAFLGGARRPPAPKSVAVLNFTGMRTDAELGAAVSEVARGVLSGLDLPQYKFVERASLNAALLGRVGSVIAAVAQEEAADYGRRMNAEYVLTGSVSKLGAAYTLSGRLINVGTGVVAKSASATADSEDALPSAVKRLAFDLFGLESATFESGAPAPQAREGSSPGGTYTTWYTDNSGKHEGGTLTLALNGNVLEGQSLEGGVSYEISGQRVGDRLVGYYKGSIGNYGSFEFDVKEGGRLLDGKYYQVSNGANGLWVGARVSER